MGAATDNLAVFAYYGSGGITLDLQQNEKLVHFQHLLVQTTCLLKK